MLNRTALSLPITETLPTWTPAMVCQRMVAAFREKPRSACAAAVIAWPARYLPTMTRERDYLLKWAATKAGQREISIGELCRQMSWPRSSFEDGRRRACRAIAAALNADRVPLP